MSGLRKRWFGPHHHFPVVLVLPVVDSPAESRRASFPWPSPSGQNLPGRMYHCSRETLGRLSEPRKDPRKLHSQRPQRSSGQDHSKMRRVTASRTGGRSAEPPSWFQHWIILAFQRNILKFRIYRETRSQ